MDQTVPNKVLKFTILAKSICEGQVYPVIFLYFTYGSKRCHNYWHPGSHYISTVWPILLPQHSILHDMFTIEFNGKTSRGANTYWLDCMLPANIRKWVYSWNKTWRNEKFHAFHDLYNSWCFINKSLKWKLNYFVSCHTQICCFCWILNLGEKKLLKYSL